MSCVIALRIAESVAAATAVLVKNPAGRVISNFNGRELAGFVWDGAAAIMSFMRLDDDNETDHELPDIAEELKSIEAKLSTIGRVRITIDLEPKEPKATVEL